MAVQSFVEFDNTGGGLTQSSFSLGVIGTNYLLKSHIKVHLGLDILAETSEQLLVDRDGGAPGSGKHYEWTNDTTIRLIDASGNAQNLASGKKLTIIRETPDSSQLVPWTDGSNLNAEALNNADKQNLFVVQEQQDKNKLSSTESRAAKTASDTATTNVANLTSTQFRSDGSAAMTGDLDVGNNKIENLADPTANQDAVTKAFLERSGSISSTQILDGTIVNADISNSAEIAVNKIADGNARELLQTAPNGTDVEWAPNIDIPGTLDVTSTVKFDSTLNVVGAVDFDNNLNVDGTLTVDGTSTLTGNVTVGGTVDGRDLASDGTKLDAIEANAKDDQTAAEIKTLLAASKLTSDHLDTNSVTTAQIADNELSVLAGMQGGTASKLAAAQTLTADINDLNQIDGLTKQSGTGLTDTDDAFPTSKAVVNFVADQIAPIGGLEVIANDQSFPNTQPASGVVISIADAGGLVVSTVGGVIKSTTGKTAGGTTVTINNIASNFNGKTVDDGVAFMVSSTGTGHVYNYHKATLKEADLLSLSNDIDDFGNRYRVLTNLPAANDASNDDGDLVWVTSTAKMMVYSGSPTGSPVGAYEEVQSVGNFFISSLSPAFDGSTIDFTVTNAPANAEQIILSINGVIQQPNAGTGRPTDGFSLNGSTIQLPTGTGPAANTPHFVIVLGSTVNIGTPSNNTVTEDILQSGCVTNAKVKTDAAIAGTKIDPDFGTQDIKTTGDIELPNDSQIAFGATQDLELLHSGNTSIIRHVTAGQDLNLQSARNIIFSNVGASTEFARIDSNGELCIGTTTGTGNNLTVQDAGTSTAAGGNIVARFQTNGAGRDATIQLSDNVSHSATVSMVSSDLIFKNAGTERLRITSDGKVGIGTDSPDFEFQVEDSSGSAVIRAKNGSVNHICDLIADGTGGLVRTVGNQPFRIDTNQVERLRITNSGNVGIGLTNPSTEFHVKGAGTVAKFEGTGGNGFISLADADDSTQCFLGCDGGAFKLQTSGSSFSDKLVVDTSGNVGIGTSSPSNLLHLKHATVNTLLRIESGDATAGMEFFDNSTTSGNQPIVGCKGNEYFIETGGLEQFRVSEQGNLKWKAHSSSHHVWTRKSFGDVSLSAGASMDIRLSEGFTNNTCIRCEYAFNWNDGNGGAWGTVIAWKHHDADHDVRFLAEEIASPADSVSIIKNGNNLDLRLTMSSGSGMNGRWMISVDHSSPNQPNAF